MRTVATIILGLSVLGMQGPTAHGAAPASAVSLTNLPEFYYGERYKVDPYIEAAVTLQSLNEQTRSQVLVDLSKDKERGRNAIVLCRMLLAQRPGGEFRRPRIGAAQFLGGTDYPDWPLEPIELVDGIPFLITRGYDLGGFPEPAEWYVRYCLTNCEWTVFHFARKTGAEEKAALAKLLSSPKWHGPLDVRDSEFLASQIGPAKGQLLNPQGGANGKQPFGSETNRTSAAAASRRSP
jgi:hypothetical protein